jgi:bifunctional non-homologous end joining protein LigD
MQLRVANGEATLLTRKGLDWSGKFPALIAEGAKLQDCVLDGEVVAIQRQGAMSFGALQNAISEGDTSQVIFYVFDLLFAGGSDLRKEPLARARNSCKSSSRPTAAPRRPSLRRALRKRWGCGAQIRLPDAP